MKKNIRISFLCTVLALVCLLTACKAPALKQDEEGGFRNPKTGVSYYPTSPNYYAKPLEGDAYARIKVENGGEDILLYEIDGVDPRRYLVSNAYSVYAAVGAELPELYDLPCVRVGFYDTQVASNDGNITEPNEIQALKTLHKDGVYTSLNNVGFYINQSTNWYDLHFFGGGEYSGIYYQLKYGVFAEDVIIVEVVEDPDNFVDFYPGVPYDLMWETYGNEEYYVAKYNFGAEIICDITTGNCYRLESSLLSYVTPQE